MDVDIDVQMYVARASLVAIQTWFDDPDAVASKFLPEDQLFEGLLAVLHRYNITRTPWIERAADTAQLVLGSTPGQTPWVRTHGEVRRAKMMADALRVPPETFKVYLVSDSTCGL